MAMIQTPRYGGGLIVDSTPYLNYYLQQAQQDNMRRSSLQSQLAKESNEYLSKFDINKIDPNDYADLRAAYDKVKDAYTNYNRAMSSGDLKAQQEAYGGLTNAKADLTGVYGMAMQLKKNRGDVSKMILAGKDGRSHVDLDAAMKAKKILGMSAGQIYSISKETPDFKIPEATDIEFKPDEGMWQKFLQYTRNPNVVGKQEEAVSPTGEVDAQGFPLVKKRSSYNKDKIGQAAKLAYLGDGKYQAAADYGYRLLNTDPSGLDDEDQVRYKQWAEAADEYKNAYGKMPEDGSELLHGLALIGSSSESEPYVDLNDIKKRESIEQSKQKVNAYLRKTNATIRKTNTSADDSEVKVRLKKQQANKNARVAALQTGTPFADIKNVEVPYKDVEPKMKEEEPIQITGESVNPATGKKVKESKKTSATGTKKQDNKLLNW